jgi:4-alpha-glucanotransferase
LIGSEPLRQRAAELGAEVSYWDVAGQLHHVPETTLRAAVDVLEADAAAGGSRQLDPVIVGPPARVPVGSLTDLELTLADRTTIELEPEHGTVALPPDVPVGCHRLAGSGPGGDEVATLVVSPRTMPSDPGLAGGVAVFVPTYALWEVNAPLPSFGQLGALVARAPRIGIDVVMTLPLYAGFFDEPFDPSPYAPVSRLHWNELYINDPSLPAAPVPVKGELLDWRGLARRRRGQLLDLCRDLDPYLETAVDRFVAERPDVAAFARYRTEHPDPGDAGRPGELVRRSHEVAQYLAHRELAAVEGPGRAVLGLDLPIGSHPEGFETWAHPDLFAPGMSVGAPPDEFFAEGQDWGFPPQLPGAARRSGHELWRRLVARAGEHASLLRIDHVMGVHRLWWIPAGAGARDGVYVRYPREELLAVIAAQAATTNTTIVGENLGTVPDEVTEAMERWHMLGMFEEQFLLYDQQDGDLEAIPARSVAGIRTHDMPAFAAAFAGDATGEVYRYQRRLEAALGRHIGERAADVLDGALERLAASDAYLVVADLDDLVGETAPHNVPGQVLETTWRRRLRRPASEILAGDDVRRRLKLLRAGRERR